MVFILFLCMYQYAGLYLSLLNHVDFVDLCVFIFIFRSPLRQVSWYSWEVTWQASRRQQVQEPVVVLMYSS